MVEHHWWIADGLSQARCDCGWKGTATDSWTDVEAEMDAHAGSHSPRRDKESSDDG